MACLIPYKPYQNINGHFLQWTPVNYFLEEQAEPIELCPPVIEPCDFECPDDNETYKLPIKIGDTIKWIINKNQIDIDGGSNVDSLKIALTKEGVLVAENIGYLEDKGGSQIYCTATIPIGIDCFKDGCDYQFVIYDDTILPNINCGIFECNTLQQVIDEDVFLGEVLECHLYDFLCVEDGQAKTTGEVYFAGTLSSELTNDPTFTTGGTWYEGGPSPISITTGSVDVASLAGDNINTAPFLVAGKVYLIEIDVSSIGIGASGNLVSGELIDVIATTGTHVFIYKKVAAFQRLVLTVSGSSFIITRFSVKEISGAPDVFFIYNVGDTVPIELTDGTLVEKVITEKNADGTGTYFKFDSFDANQTVKVYY